MRLYLILPVLIAFNSLASDFNLSDLEQRIAQAIPDDEPGCSIGVYEKGQPLLNKGFGLANLELKVPMADNNVHRMGSVSKQFTAMAVRLLEEQGKISLQDDIRKHVSGLPDYGYPITINSIIAHTAGMGDYDMISLGGVSSEAKPAKGSLNLKAVSGVPFRIGNEDYLSNAEFHALVKKLPLRHAPDKKWDYSNMGYVLLAILVEEVSGLTLREFSDKHIFKPLNMHNTFFSDDATEIVKNRAYGYMQDDDGKYVNNMTNLFWVGDGGLHTTIEDMQKWSQHFYQPKLGKDPQRFMQAFMQANNPIPVNPDKGADTFYANGQFVKQSENGLKVSHGGGWLGARIAYSRYPKEQFMNLVMCSNVSIDAQKIANSIEQWYFQH
ncbi:serine hydrolase domain-containing protein [Paraglaciecola aestuariivivens]